MEVHHHAHTPRKKWNHYFWEFLMLFLAVTLGFLVENQREHYIEKIRAKDFSKTLVKDLQNDTAAIHAHIKTTKIYVAIADSLLSLSQTRLDGREASLFSFYTRFLYWTVPIVWNRATFEQIKNSGSLRYFRNYSLLETMIKYEAIVNRVELETYHHQVRGNMLLNQINVIIDPSHHYELSKHYIWQLDTMSRKTIESLLAPTESLENKRPEIREMLNMMIVQQRNLRFNRDVLWKQAEELAIALINDLKKEYRSK